MKARELPGFKISLESYQKADTMIVTERKLGHVPAQTTTHEYLQSLLSIAISFREKELKVQDKKNRLVLTPDELAGRD